MKKSNNSFSNAFIRQMLYEYVTLADNYSRAFFCKKYNLTTNNFKHIVKKGIEQMLVDDKTCLKIKEKAIRNAKAYGKSSNISELENYYDKLFFNRAIFAKENNLKTSFCSYLKTIEKIHYQKHVPLTQEELENKIKKYNFLIKTHKDFAFEEENSPSLDDLYKKLRYYEKELRFLKMNIE